MRRILCCIIIVILSVPIRSAHAAPSPGTLVKGSQPAVYYVATDGKRYTFPNENIYRTWYSNFVTVQRITDADLAVLPLGGNVTYKPGSRLVKIESDPKVYAVDHGGVLRWIATEGAARALFGSAWSRMVDDVPVALFVNYRTGAAVRSTNDYDPGTVTSGTRTIAVDLAIARGTLSAPASALAVAAPPTAPPIPPTSSTPPPVTSSTSTTAPTAPSAPPPASATSAPPPSTDPPKAETIPSCSGQQFTALPVAFDALESITPLGNLSPRADGGHVLPTDHTYWHLPGRLTEWTLEPLYAPGDVTITLIRSGRDTDPARTDGGNDYALHFKLCQDVEGIFGHVKEIAPALQQAAAGVPCLKNWVDCAQEVSLRVRAGERIGMIGGAENRGVDLGLYDQRVTLAYANAHRIMHDRGRHAVCPFDTFTADRRAQIDAKLPASVRGSCGAIMQDIPGTLAGNWFLASVPDDTHSKGSEQMSFSYEARDPAQRMLSTGGQFAFTESGAGFPIGPERSSGRINRAYRDVTPDGNTYCFERASGLHTKIIVQLIDANTLHIEKQVTPQLSAPDFLACTSNEQFVNPVIYRR